LEAFSAYGSKGFQPCVTISAKSVFLLFSPVWVISIDNAETEFVTKQKSVLLCNKNCDIITFTDEKIKEVDIMPNIKSAKKRVLVSSFKTLNNRMAKTALKTLLKRFETAYAVGDKADIEQARAAAVKAVDKAAARGLIHKNKAANKKSKMALRVNKIA
jgi:small subunit ribosomal protein S20